MSGRRVSRSVGQCEREREYECVCVSGWASGSVGEPVGQVSGSVGQCVGQYEHEHEHEYGHEHEYEYEYEYEYQCKCKCEVRGANECTTNTY